MHYTLTNFFMMLISDCYCNFKPTLMDSIGEINRIKPSKT